MSRRLPLASPSVTRRIAVWGVAVFAVWARAAMALDVTDYSATVNDRFTSGFPTSPVPNTSGSFVGAGYDWSGIGWSTTIYAASSYKGFALLSPRHFLTAQHYENGGLLTQGVRILGRDGQLATATNTGIDNLGYGIVLTNVGVTAPDLALGTLGAQIAAPANMARYAVLDLNSSSISPSFANYTGLTTLAYGRGSVTNGSPRAATAVIDAAGTATLDPTSTIVLTARSGTPSVQLVEGDSGSPLLVGWTNPGGSKELTVIGLNSAVSGSSNVMSFLAVPGAMNAVNGVITPDGYALRTQGNVNATWTGASNSSISLSANWSGGTRTDQYVKFDASGSVPTSVNMNGATTLRGLYFTSGTGATQGFTFSGANTLTIGRGGLTNYSALRQTFSASLTLGDHQYWDVGTGGVTAAAINTNGKLIEIAGSGTARITGAVSGTGGLALSGHRLEITGSSSYTGGTWAHAGTLVVDGNIAASSGVILDAGAALGGTGRVSAISGAGMVGPGNSPGILTATSVDPSGGLDFGFEFGKTGAPIWATGTASGNDVLRLTAGTPITSALTASNAVSVYLGVTSVAKDDVFQGGIFTDASADFLSSIQNAAFTYYVLGNGAGSATTYNGQGYYLLDTSFWPAFESVTVSTVTVPSANFAGGTVTNGRVMQLTIVPEPGAALLALLGAGVAAAAMRRRG
ncbi:MAG: PEP-CTERM sorting domain-containing protein [Planctomycetes bacterium]|nr:PEP-CTERM sorting domain-containing protein [Planctomycetota bacterium]